MTDKEVSKKAEKTVSQLKMLGIGLQVKRNELGWSIAEVARLSKVHYSYISRVEKGLIWPGAEILQKILTVMRVEIALVGGVSFVKQIKEVEASPGAVSLPNGKGLEQTTSEGPWLKQATDAMAKKYDKQRDRAIDIMMSGSPAVIITALTDDLSPDLKIAIEDGRKMFDGIGISPELDGAPEQKNLNDAPAAKKGWDPNSMVVKPKAEKKKAAPVITGFKGELKRKDK